MKATLLVLVPLLLISLTVSASAYIQSPPPTVYENPVRSPQNMDFDHANNMFIAHPGWLNDRLIHYYKFRMFTPATYPTRVPMQGAVNIPVAPLYLITTSGGDFSKIVQGQKPIIRWHTADGEAYSDFVQLFWVVVPQTYLANTYKSYEDVNGNVSSSIVQSNIYANLPVVPTGSKLQDPIALGTNGAPITPLMVWYKGVEVQTFVFETTSQQFADYFNPITRTGTAATRGSGYEISVVSFVSQGRVNTIPIYHLNQYSLGVTQGVNNGGPWKGGGKNIIGFDRNTGGYSPLWQVFWVAKVPIDYSADQASNPAQLTTDNGFQVNPAPMYVNCPNVGPVGGGATNPKKASSFGRSVGSGETFNLAGALVMVGNKAVTAYLGQTVLATATTNMMGAFVFNISADKLADGQSTISVKDDSGNLLFDVTVTKTSGAIFGVLPTIPTIVGILVAVVVAAGLLIYRRYNKSPKHNE